MPTTGMAAGLFIRPEKTSGPAVRALVHDHGTDSTGLDRALDLGLERAGPATAGPRRRARQPRDCPVSRRVLGGSGAIRLAVGTRKRKCVRVPVAAVGTEPCRGPATAGPPNMPIRPTLGWPA